MNIESMVALAIGLLVLAASPGPGVLATVGASISGGLGSALCVIAGIILGDVLLLVLAMVGLATIASSLGPFFVIVKIAGGGYLICMGIGLLIARRTDMDLPVAQAPISARRGVSTGLVVTLANPKAILFYAAFLPTFVDLASLTFTGASIVILIVIVIIGCVLTAYACTGNLARKMFRQPKAVQRMRRLSGLTMIGVGTAVATR